MKNVIKDIWKSRDKRYGKTKGIKDFFILVLVYNYFTRKDDSNPDSEFMILESTIAKYFNRTGRTAANWFNKMRETGCIEYAIRSDAGTTGKYRKKDENTGEYVLVDYIKPKYKKKYIQKDDTEISYANIYKIHTIKLNEYIKEHLNIDVLANIDSYKQIFNDFVSFMAKLNVVKSCAAEPSKSNEIPINDDKLVKAEIRKQRNIEKKIKENVAYLGLKKHLDLQFPGFESRYLEEGCLRLTSDICNTKNTIPKDIGKLNRTNILEKFFMTSRDNIIEYDTNGSIYRLTYNLNNDPLLSTNLDIYKEIWLECGFDTNEYKLYRNLFKKFLMPIYMRDFGISYRTSHYNFLNKYYKDNIHLRPKADIEFYEITTKLMNITNLNCLSLMTTISQAMHKVLNTKKFYRSDIFIHESNLHLLMRYKFLNNNIKTIHVYDGFYFEKDNINSQLFNQIYNESVLDLKDNLSRGIGTPLIK